MELPIIDYKDKESYLDKRINHWKYLFSCFTHHIPVISIRTDTHRFAKRPITPCETARIELRTGPFRKVKWAFLQRAVAQCVTRYGKRACAEGHAVPRETCVRRLPTGPAAVARAVGRNSKKGVFALPIAQIVLYLQIICGRHCGGSRP